MLRVLGTGAALLLGASGAVCAGAPPATPAPAVAIGGTLDATTGPLAGRVPASVTAVRLGADGEVRGALADAKGRYRLHLTPGMWLVTRTTWAGRHARQEALLVTGGPRRTAPDRPTRMIAVNRFMSPSGVDLAPLLRAALGATAADTPCRVTLAAAAAAMREVVRLAPDLAPSARRALAAQRRLRPRFVLTGRFTSFTDDDTGESEAVWQVTDRLTGRTLERARGTSDGGGLRRLADIVTYNAASTACGLAYALDGTLRGSVTVDGVTRTVDAEARFQLNGGGGRPGVVVVGNYLLEEFRGTIGERGTDGAGCAHDGTAPIARMHTTLTVRVEREGGDPTYTLESTAETDDTPVTITCPGAAPVVTTRRLVSGTVSPVNQPFTGPLLAGSSSGPWRNPFGVTDPAVLSAPLVSAWRLAPLPSLEISKRWPEPPAA